MTDKKEKWPEFTAIYKSLFKTTGAVGSRSEEYPDCHGITKLAITTINTQIVLHDGDFYQLEHELKNIYWAIIGLSEIIIASYYNQDSLYTLRHLKMKARKVWAL